MCPRISSIRNARKSKIDLPIFINFDPKSIYHPATCLEETAQAARDAGTDPSGIVFEVTETEGVENLTHLIRILDYFRSAGFRVALDDIGSGYNGLSLLRDLRPDFIKLDKTLIRNVERDPFKQHVGRHVLDLANTLGILTIVEGIETLSEWSWSKEHGATHAQGHFYAKPAVEPAFEPDNKLFAPAIKALELGQKAA